MTFTDFSFYSVYFLHANCSDKARSRNHVVPGSFGWKTPVYSHLTDSNWKPVSEIKLYFFPLLCACTTSTHIFLIFHLSSSSVKKCILQHMSRFCMSVSTFFITHCHWRFAADGWFWSFLRLLFPSWIILCFSFQVSSSSSSPAASFLVTYSSQSVHCFFSRSPPHICMLSKCVKSFSLPARWWVWCWAERVVLLSR